MENGVIAPHILNLGTGWRPVISFTSQSLYRRGNSPQYPKEMGLGGPQNQFGIGVEKNISAPAWKRTAVVLPTVLTELSRLLISAQTLIKLFHGILEQPFVYTDGSVWGLFQAEKAGPCYGRVT